MRRILCEHGYSNRTPSGRCRFCVRASYMRRRESIAAVYKQRAQSRRNSRFESVWKAMEYLGKSELNISGVMKCAL